MFDQTMLDEYIVGIAAVLSAVGVVWLWVRKAYNLSKKIDEALNNTLVHELNGMCTTVTGRLDEMDKRFTRVEHQLWPNGGTSLADKVNRIEASQQAMTGELSIIKELIIKNNN